MHLTVVRGNSTIIIRSGEANKSILIQNSCLVYTCGQTPLHIASFGVHFTSVSMIRLQIKCGADTEAVDENKNTPFHYSAINIDSSGKEIRATTNTIGKYSTIVPNFENSRDPNIVGLPSVIIEQRSTLRPLVVTFLELRCCCLWGRYRLSRPLRSHTFERRNN